MLNSLRQKAFQLMRLKKGERAGLLDSGAIHPLRPIKRGEKKDLYEKVQVALADGQTTWLPITPGGVMLSEDQDIEPIIPMGLLTKQLNIAQLSGHMDQREIGGCTPHPWTSSSTRL